MGILVWLIIWYGTFAGYYFFFKKGGVLYANSPKAIASWYGIATTVSIAFYFDQLRGIVASASLKAILVGIIILGVSIAIWGKILVRRKYVEKEVSENIFAAKTAEVTFQQVMIWSLVSLLQGGLYGSAFINLFAGVFFLIHIPLLLALPLRRAMPFVVASFFGGLVFGFCVMYVPAGWLIAWALHILFYACIASQKTIFGMPSFYRM